MMPFPPIDQAMISGITDTFSKVSVVVIGLMGMITVARFSMLIVRVAPPDSYAAVLKEAVTVLVALTLFPFVIKIAVSSVSEISQRLSFQAIEMRSGPVSELIDTVYSWNIVLQVLGAIGKVSFQYIVRAIFSLILGVSCAAIPLILLGEFIFGFSMGLHRIGATIFAFLMWPVLWNLLGLLALSMWPSFGDTSLSNFIFYWIVQLAQLFSPLFCASVLRTASPGSVAVVANKFF